MMFIFLAISIVLIVVLFLLFPLFFRKKQPVIIERDAVNVESAAARLSELKEELETGQITEEQFQRYRLELETTALKNLNTDPSVRKQGQKRNTVLAIIMAVIIPFLSVFIYQMIGSEEALVGQQITPVDSAAAREADQKLEKILAAVEDDVRKHPDDVEGRIALGQVYVEQERFSDAAAIYREVYQLRPEEPDILVNYAEALARSHGNRMTGKPAELLNEALGIEPNHGRALWLAGFAEKQANNTEAALTHWRHLLKGLETDSDFYQKVKESIADAESGDTRSDSVTIAGSADANQSIEVNVSLAPELQAKVDSDTTLFIFARASEGPPMPLAVHRALAKDLPITVTLDDSMAMMPEMSISHFQSVVVGARLSSNGQPQGQSGDFEGFSDVVEKSTNSTVDVVINLIKP